MQSETVTRVVGGFVGAVVIAVGFLSFTPVLSSAAQDPSGPRRGGPGGPGGPGGRGGRFGDLSDAQREQIKAIRDRHATELKPLIEQSQAARKALHDNVLAGGGNLRGLALDLGKAEGDLAFANAGVELEMLAVLTPEQRQKMQDRQKEQRASRRAQPEK